LLFGKEPPITELTSDQQEILSLWNKLDPIKQAEFKGGVKGIHKGKGREIKQKNWQSAS